MWPESGRDVMASSLLRRAAMLRKLALAFLVAAAFACTAEPTSSVVEHDGPRNLALRDAARAHAIPIAWLAAVGYQQGRFEAAEMTSDPNAPAEANAADDTLGADTPVDEADAADPSPAPADDGAASGDDATLPTSWGVMYLTDDQVAAAAQLTGRAPDEIRTDVAANIDAAAALIAQGWAEPHTDDGLRAATTQFLGLADPDDAALALGDLDDVIRDGFDLTTSDGEELELVGTDPHPAEPLAATPPGKTPPFEWIPSPNFSSRLGYPIRYIVIHDIEGTMAGAISVFKKSSSQTSAHYIVRARDGHIVKMVYEHDNAWHAGHGWFNRHSIGIEHEGFAFRKDGGGYYTDRQYRASAALACSIAVRYHIPVDRKHIFGHFNVPSNLASHTLCSDAAGIAGRCGGTSHHADPGRYWNWTKYMSLVRTCVNAAK
jgi:N-acetyl-anhydromuramyl-L-alanine amidase AmpD